MSPLNPLSVAPWLHCRMRCSTPMVTADLAPAEMAVWSGLARSEPTRAKNLMRSLQDSVLPAPLSPLTTARAGNRRFWLLSALRAHTKTPYKNYLHRKTLMNAKGA